MKENTSRLKIKYILRWRIFILYPFISFYCFSFLSEPVCQMSRNRFMFTLKFFNLLKDCILLTFEIDTIFFLIWFLYLSMNSLMLEHSKLHGISGWQNQPQLLSKLCFQLVPAPQVWSELFLPKNPKKYPSRRGTACSLQIFSSVVLGLTYKNYSTL